jgi:hypothetical protein
MQLFLNALKWIRKFFYLMKAEIEMRCLQKENPLSFLAAGCGLSMSVIFCWLGSWHKVSLLQDKPSNHAITFC